MSKFRIRFETNASGVAMIVSAIILFPFIGCSSTSPSVAASTTNSVSNLQSALQGTAMSVLGIIGTVFGIVGTVMLMGFGICACVRCCRTAPTGLNAAPTGLSACGSCCQPTQTGLNATPTGVSACLPCCQTTPTGLNATPTGVSACFPCCQTTPSSICACSCCCPTVSKPSGFQFPSPFSSNAYEVNGKICSSQPDSGLYRGLPSSYFDRNMLRPGSYCQTQNTGQPIKGMAAAKNYCVLYN